MILILVFQIAFVLFISLFSWAWGDQRTIEPPIRVDLQPPEEYRSLNTRNVLQNWIRMPLDHFNPQNPDTFLMVCTYISHSQLY